MNNYGEIISGILPSGGEIDYELNNIGDISELLFFVNSTSEQVELLILKSDGVNWLSTWQSIGILGALGVGTGGYVEQLWGGFLGEKIKIKLRNTNPNVTTCSVTLQGRTI